MSLINDSENKGIVFTAYIGKGKKFRKRWVKKFTEGIDRSVKMSINVDEFLWHVFSYKVIPCLIKNEAVNAFENEKKNSCYVFYQNSDIVYILDNADDLKAKDLQHEQDVFVVDTGFNWTYVQTHENDCGPYFLKSSMS